MPISDSSASPNSASVNPDLPPDLEIDELLQTLQHSHNVYYKMMNLEVWAIVETLDKFFPGSWGRFMTNRHAAMKQFLHRQHGKGSSADTGFATSRKDGAGELGELFELPEVGEQGPGGNPDSLKKPPEPED